MTDSPNQQTGSSESVRKLAAIMFTDIVSFSKQMGKDEHATLQLLDIHNRIVSGIIGKHSGRIIKSIGDAFFVEFDSSVSAVACAVEAQTTLKKYNEEHPEENPIVIRIGVHVGDVVKKNNDLFGDGVNIAARIQPKAEPGGICISEDVARQVRGKINLPLVKAGVGDLKNIDIPIVLYHIELPWQKIEVQPEKHQPEAKAGNKKLFIMAGIVLTVVVIGFFGYWFMSKRISVPEGERSLVILPFQNAGESANDYLVDGITDEVNRHLSKSPGLLVISKSATQKYKGNTVSNDDVASRFGVRFVLSATVQCTQTQFNITSRVYDAKEKRTVWEESYEKPRAEIMNAGENIESKIFELFEIPQDARQLHTKVISPDAYEAYLRGLYQNTKSGSSENALAIVSFTEAISKQPDFLDALLLLAESKVRQYEEGWDPRVELLNEAESIITDVAKKDQSNAQLFAIYGSIEQRRGNQTKAMEYFQRALALDVHNIAALTRAAILYFDNFGEPAKAVSYLKRVYELNPNDGLITSNLGVGYARLNNYSEAKRMFWKAVELQPNIKDPWINLGAAYERLGTTDSAMFCYEKAIEIDPANVLTYENILPLLLSLERFTKAESLITSGMKYLQSSHELFYFLGMTNEHTGKREEAEQSYKQGLRMVKLKLEKNSNIPDYYMYESLFQGKLREQKEALDAASKAIRIDSTNPYAIMNRAKVAALLGAKEDVLHWYQKARFINSDFDAAYLATTIEFEKFRNDPDLLLIARTK